MAKNKIGLILGEDEYIEGKFGDNMNALIVGPPGGGKTYSVVSPNIVKSNGCSMFIDDKKGNLYHKHKEQLEKEGYKVYCFNLINFKGDMHYNPFETLKTRDDIHKIVNFLIPEEKNSYDPYWTDSARELAEAIIGILMLGDKPVTFRSLIKLIHKTGTKYEMVGNVETPTEDYVDELINSMRIVGKECTAMDRYKSLRQNAPDTWRSVRASCISALSVYDSDNIFEVTDETTMDFNQMATKKVALFVTSSDINGAYAPLVQLMYRDIVQRLIEFADNNYVEKNSMLPQHVRFILDDFASGTVMNGFERVIANCRSRNISFMLCIQSLTQLKGLYRDMADSILDCINYKVYFSSSNLATQQHLSVIMDVPLSDIQELGCEDICIEQINRVPRFGKRYPADTLFTKSKVKSR
ncbi:MAG: hypothetical protein E7222_10455 [Clostridiales bacterium]|nr:hypothetical protein [Clostridiales bacterium]